MKRSIADEYCLSLFAVASSRRARAQPPSIIEQQGAPQHLDVALVKRVPVVQRGIAAEARAVVVQPIRELRGVFEAGSQRTIEKPVELLQYLGVQSLAFFVRHIVGAAGFLDDRRIRRKNLLISLTGSVAWRNRSICPAIRTLGFGANCAYNAKASARIVMRKDTIAVAMTVPLRRRTKNVSTLLSMTLTSCSG